MTKETTFQFYQECRALYKVTKDGKVLSSNPYRKGSQREMKQTLDRYAYVDLSLNGRRKKIGVHSLVCFEYLGEPPKKSMVCHKNDIKTDNRLENLYYGTAKTNKNDQFINGIGIGESHPNCKIPDSTIQEIRYLFASGVRQKDLANSFNMSKSTIHGIVRNKTRNKTLKDLGESNG